MLYNHCMEYKSNQNVVYSCKYHVVWCPKDRQNSGHVHLLVEVDPQFGIHRLRIKKMD